MLKEDLPRVLTLRDLTYLVVGGVIGSGIFLTPGRALEAVDYSVPLVLGAWLAGGLLSLIGALTYGELAAARPQAGGLYVYIRDCFGPLPAFLFGWMFFFIVGTGTVAALAVAFAEILSSFVAGRGWVHEAHLGHWWQALVAVAVIATLTAVNIRGARHGANLQNWTTLLKAGVLVLMAVVLIVLGQNLFGAGPEVEIERRGLSLLSAFGLAMVPVLWTYEGWQAVTFSAGELKDPQRTFPRAMLFGVLILTGVYLLANVGYLAALGPAGVAQTTVTRDVAPQALTAVLGPWAGIAITLVILISVYSATNATLLTCPRVYYAMARDGLFFRQLGEVHPRFRTPALAIALGSVWAAVLAVSGTFDQLLTYVVFGGWAFYALAGAAVFVYRVKIPAAERPYRVPGYPVTPAIFILAAIAFLGNTLATERAESLIGLGIIVAGIPVYFIWTALSRKGS